MVRLKDCTLTYSELPLAIKEFDLLTEEVNALNVLFSALQRALGRDDKETLVLHYTRIYWLFTHFYITQDQMRRGRRVMKYMVEDWNKHESKN